MRCSCAFFPAMLICAAAFANAPVNSPGAMSATIVEGTATVERLRRLSAALSTCDTRTQLTQREFVSPAGHHFRSRTNSASA